MGTLGQLYERSVRNNAPRGLKCVGGASSQHSHLPLVLPSYPLASLFGIAPLKEESQTEVRDGAVYNNRFLLKTWPFSTEHVDDIKLRYWKCRNFLER